MSAGSDASVWRALSSPVRRRILDLLRDCPRTTTELAARFPRLSRFAVMQHLRVLERAHLLLVRRVGRERFNYLNVAPIQTIYDRWVSTFIRHSASAGNALKHFVEQGEATCPNRSSTARSAPPTTKSRSRSMRRSKTSGERSRGS